MNLTKTTALLLAVLTAAGTVTALASCADQKTSGDVKSTEAETAAETTAETEAVDPFEGFDYGGEEIRILCSMNDYDGWGSSGKMIVNEEEQTGDVVQDAVYQRNKYVEDLLNVKFVFTENTEDYTKIPKTISTMVMAGDDSYDLIIHDLFPLATLSVQGNFLNAQDGKYFDFTQDYWYSDYMADVSFNKDVYYLLAGDYFIDILRSAHALYFNKELFNSLFESSDELYQHVLDGTWTQDVFLSYVTDTYSDLNGDGKKDANDQYGYDCIGTWGSAIPWIISSDLSFITYDSDGKPTLGLNNEKSITLLQKLNDIFYSTGSFVHTDVQVNTDAFMSGKALFGGYQRVASLEVFRDMKTEIGILPYPKFDESQEKYITSSHDTANVGVIPMTCSKLETVSAVLEVLNRETNKTVMPAYYETALKVKYTRDDTSAQMLDIIRDGISCAFPVAFGNYCANLPLYYAFSVPLGQKKTDFASNYTKYEKKAQSALDELYDSFVSIGNS